MKPQRENRIRPLLLRFIILASIIYLLYDWVSFESNKTALPKWIYSLEPAPYSKVPPTGRICVTIALRQIWKKGDQPEQLGNEIHTGTRISVNGNLSTPYPGGLFGDIDEVRDENGNVIGQTFHQLDECFFLDVHKVGAYNSTIKIYRKSGEIYTFFWTFEVSDSVPTYTPYP